MANEVGEYVAPTKLGVEAKGLIQQKNGASMDTLSMQRQSSRIELEHSGRLKPCTIINFNPVPLKVEDGNIPWHVPACTDRLKKGIVVPFGGKKYEAAVVTLATARFVPWLREARASMEGAEDPRREFDTAYILPIEQGHQFRSLYALPEGQIGMGGVLVFEGDIHAFTRKERDKPQTLRIPAYATLPNKRRSYFSQEVDLLEEMREMLDMQKRYAERMIMQGDEYDQDALTRHNISGPHRTWAQFSLTMGWKEQAPSWMNAKFDSEVSCKGCGAPQKRSDAWFCQCGRPYNPYAAFMAGENVPESYIFALKGAELDDVLKEMARREELMAKLKAKG